MDSCYHVQVLGEVQESVKTGLWAGDCFIYTNAVNRLNYYVGGEIVTISHLDRFVASSGCTLCFLVLVLETLVRLQLSL